MAKGNWSHIQKTKGHKSGLEDKINEQLSVKAFDKLIDAAHDKERPVVSGLVFAWMLL